MGGGLRRIRTFRKHLMKNGDGLTVRLIFGMIFRLLECLLTFTKTKKIRARGADFFGAVQSGQVASFAA
jgi:hypothetical protein